jgi:hypothetical protein
MPIDTSEKTLAAVQAVFDATEAALDKMMSPVRQELRGPRTPKPSARKRRRLEVRASRRANRGA